MNKNLHSEITQKCSEIIIFIVYAVIQKYSFLFPLADLYCYKNCHKLLKEILIT